MSRTHSHLSMAIIRDSNEYDFPSHLSDKIYKRCINAGAYIVKKPTLLLPEQPQNYIIVRYKREAKASQ